MVLPFGAISIVHDNSCSGVSICDYPCGLVFCWCIGVVLPILVIFVNMVDRLWSL